MSKRTSNYGFTLSIVLVLSTALIILALALLQTVSVNRKDSIDQYYNKLAEEAAEAGVAHATSCLEANDHIQTWGPGYSGGARPNLDPRTNCAGSSAAYPSKVYVYTDNYLQTRYSVGNLEDSLSDSALISSTGYVEVKVFGTSTITKTYTHVIKKLITWDANLSSQASSSGTRRTCGVLSNNVYCWGTNEWGQLGNGTDGGGTGSADSIVPVKVVRQTYPGGIGDHDILELRSTSFTNCVIIETNEVYCWGNNNVGQLGRGSAGGYSNVPVLVNGGGVLTGRTITTLGVSENTICAVESVGNLFCWGENGTNAVGDGTTTDRSTPVQVGGPAFSVSGNALSNRTVTGASRSGAFSDNMCAVADELAFCWGSNQNGEAGTGASTVAYSRPTAVSTGASSALNGKKVLSIASDGDASASSTANAHTCALAYTTTTADAKVYCWGSNYQGRVGNNGNVPGTWTASSFCTNNNWIYCYPQAVYTTSPNPLNGKTVTEIGVNAVGGCAVAYPTGGSLNDRRAYCWGGVNVRGDGVTSGGARTPVTVVDVLGLFAGNTVDNMIGGAFRMCARVLERAFCWGTNGVGQIGDGTTVSPRNQPTEALFLRGRDNQYIF